MLTCGAWMSAISNNMGPVARCGFPWRILTRCYSMRLPEKALRFSELSVLPTVGLLQVVPRSFVQKRFSIFFAMFCATKGKSARWLSLSITPVITTPGRSSRGWRSTEMCWLWIFCHYSPELNCIERVWKLTRRLRTHNRYFAKIDKLIQTVFEPFDAWRRPNKTLSRLCAIT